MNHNLIFEKYCALIADTEDQLNKINHASE